MNDQMKEYRAKLQEVEQRAQLAFDKTLLTLSGGALGVSFAFVRDFVGDKAASKSSFLLAAWLGWVASLAVVLLSHYFSTLALRKAVDQVDAGTIASETPGGGFDKAVAWLNGIGAVLFLIGLVLVGVFVQANLR